MQSKDPETVDLAVKKLKQKIIFSVYHLLWLLIRFRLRVIILSLNYKQSIVSHHLTKLELWKKLKAVRGTKDIGPEQSALWQFVEAKAIEIFANAGFGEIRTPIFEHTPLFSRAVGEDSDIVNKEMYTFNDRSDRSLTLRPEGTAGVVRAFIEASLERLAKPQKLWYRGPMFRYERPQTGRFRQFHQIGIEALGLDAPYVDLEVISVAMQFLKALGLKDLTLYVNSIGNEASRDSYRTALKEFLTGIKDQVCEDCQRRYEQNPLRVLDCKVPADQELYKNAPKITDYLDEQSQLVWKQFKAGLDELEISYSEDFKLVRGLDYYSHVVFEIKTEDPGLGQQSTVLAGGRYDKLVEISWWWAGSSCWLGTWRREASLLDRASQARC